MVSTLQSPITRIFTSILVEYRRACGHEDVSTPSFGSRLNLILGEQIIGLVSTPIFESHRRSWHMMKVCFNLKQTQSKSRELNALDDVLEKDPV